MIRLLLARLRAADPPAPGRATTPGTNPRAALPPPSCGWFDSSRELRAGLLVREHSDAQALADGLPLADWLACYLATESFTTVKQPAHRPEASSQA